MPYLLCYYCGNVCCYNYNISSLPFVRSGNIVVSDGNFNVIGYVGGYRSSTIESNTQSYMLWFKPDVVYSVQGWNLHAGFPLRCLYPGSA